MNRRLGGVPNGDTSGDKTTTKGVAKQEEKTTRTLTSPTKVAPPDNAIAGPEDEEAELGYWRRKRRSRRRSRWLHSFSSIFPSHSTFYYLLFSSPSVRFIFVVVVSGIVRLLLGLRDRHCCALRPRTQLCSRHFCQAHVDWSPLHSNASSFFNTLCMDVYVTTWYVGSGMWSCGMWERKKARNQKV